MLGQEAARAPLTADAAPVLLLCCASLAPFIGLRARHPVRRCAGWGHPGWNSFSACQEMQGSVPVVHGFLLWRVVPGLLLRSRKNRLCKKKDCGKVMYIYITRSFKQRPQNEGCGWRVPKERIFFFAGLKKIEGVDPSTSTHRWQLISLCCSTRAVEFRNDAQSSSSSSPSSSGRQINAHGSLLIDGDPGSNSCFAHS